MRELVFSTLILLTICSFAFAQADETARLRKLREKSFCDPQLTPLLSEDFIKFTGLNYYDFDETYRIKAILVKTIDVKTFLMPTTAGGSRKYLKIGVLNFKLNNKDYSLSAFSREVENKKELFVPFRDLSNGKQTYSAGRYLYLPMPKANEEVILDFNLAVNPSCAYGNESFTCSLPPKENFLQVEISAGEKKFISSNQKH